VYDLSNGSVSSVIFIAIDAFNALCAQLTRDLFAIAKFLFCVQSISIISLKSFVMCSVKSSELTYNAALNRPAYQISVYTERGVRFPPDLANDGSRHTIFNTGTKCAISDKHTNPWWAVDLGRPTTVYRVYFTNIEHAGGM